MKTYDVHPAANIFPLLTGKEFDDLMSDIDAHGLCEPIRLYDGLILDGRNRYNACRQLGIDVDTVDVPLETDPFDYVWSMNAERRHLNAGQRTALKLLQLEASEEWKKMEAAKRTKADYPRDDSGKYKPLVSIDTNGSSALKIVSLPGRTREQLGQMAGSSPATAARVLTVRNERPDLFQQVGQGTIKLNEATRLAHRDKVKDKVAAFPEGKFRVVYADPPWSYGNSGAGMDQYGYGFAERHYPTMSITELRALDVKSHVADDAVLFLWVTSPLLDECWDVSRAWGFEYKSSFIWDKVKHNFGHYNSVRHELLLVCTRGSCTPDTPKLFDSVQSIERTDEHSEKPEEFRRIIETLYPHGAKLELFARKTVPGWTAYGNEVRTCGARSRPHTARNPHLSSQTSRSSKTPIPGRGWKQNVRKYRRIAPLQVK